jgi:ferrous iron transport protein B
MHFVGLAVAIPVALVLNTFMRLKRSPFVLEMPPYRVPQWRDVLWRMWERGREFVIRAGTIIFAFSIVIWAMLYFPRPAELATQTTQRFTRTVAIEQDLSEAQVAEKLAVADSELAGRLDNTLRAAYIEQSIMGRVGKAIQPVFAPAGFDWKITVGLVASFPAREVVISTLGIIYSLGDVDEQSPDLRSTMAASKWSDGSRVFTMPVVLAMMVFFALCAQCGATVATIARETNWKWAAFNFCYMTALAWLGAVVTYQVGTWVGTLVA